MSLIRFFDGVFDGVRAFFFAIVFLPVVFADSPRFAE
tara:strand:+ start:233 stop:343 length:111 start_codon:yes stop_codon:yes gene_type:complete